MAEREMPKVPERATSSITPRKESPKGSSAPRNKVVKGAVRRLNATSSAVVSRGPLKFSDTRLGKILSDAATFVVKEVLIPAGKDMLYSAIRDGGERIIYRGDEGNYRGSSRSRSSRTGSTYSYSSLYDPNNRRDARGRDSRDIAPWEERNSRSSRDVNDIVLATREDAIEVLSELHSLIEQYDFATVAQLKDLVGITEKHTDHKWGWESLDGATHRRVRDGGYLLVLPRVVEIR